MENIVIISLFKLGKLNKKVQYIIVSSVCGFDAEWISEWGELRGSPVWRLHWSGQAAECSACAAGGVCVEGGA